MTNVENGSFVSFDYKGTLDNGKVFDTSANRQPLEFKMGAGHVIKGLEENLLGMALNEKKHLLSPLKMGLVRETKN
ncbi:MAG: hypothetical protein OMM_06873 [Candidatus Magnetoglobus multicellularis str. Araruama]|uniref:Peptidyl-prolyl cis-trans isomerase n=1 Tax=Candidatus Magnetoglobus multicellularis str. Araruama TaxID=890399 RepID=A0A1V1PF46_9BACT|nr:MAG: hypothetical protein OMM_06873 [Candidatus Magnetoglobus multicellularis str. Araruama]